MWYRVFLKFVNDIFLLVDSKIITLLLGVIILVCIGYFSLKRKHRKLPPGPTGLPVFGYYPFLGKEPGKTLKKLGEKYGNVIGLYLGPQYLVVLNDWEALKDGLNQTASLDRPAELFEKVPYKLGFVGTNGAEWIESRRLTSRVMKDIGLHSARLEDLVQEEVQEVVQQIIEQGERPIKVREFLCESFANTIVTLILGERLEHGNSVTKGVVKAVDAILEYTPTLGMANFSPTLYKVLQFMGFEKKSLLFEKTHEFGEFISNVLDERIEKLEIKNENSFVSSYYEEIEKEKEKNKPSYITVYALKGAVISLLAGGSETSRTTIVWALMAMADHPDIQQKVHEELDKVIGKDGSIRWADRFKIPYTYATVLESMRYSTVVPLSTMRCAAEDMQVQGYFIPKGTFITGNFWAIHNDPNYWEKPDQFIPERFLLDGGKKVNTAPESFCPFSYGKRICPGKLVANMEILQYFTILMQNFKTLPKEGDKVKYETLLGLSYQATNVELRFIRR